jgi:hypothetical protein
MALCFYKPYLLQLFENFKNVNSTFLLIKKIKESLVLVFEYFKIK